MFVNSCELETVKKKWFVAETFGLEYLESKCGIGICKTKLHFAGVEIFLNIRNDVLEVVSKPTQNFFFLEKFEEHITQRSSFFTFLFVEI